MSDHVPEEIVTGILLRLPVEPLLRFRSVSKQWLDLIDSPIFIKSHLNHSQKTNSNRTLVFARGKIYCFELDSLDYARKRLKSPFDDYDPSITILGSCNGILCLLNIMANCDNSIVFWNPATRNLHKIEFLPGIQYLEKGVLVGTTNVFGFGYHHLNDDYKLIRINQYFLQNGEYAQSDILIYSLKSKSWRRISRHFPYYFLTDEYYDTLVGGALHWVVTRKCNKKVHFIAAFDLGIEEFRLLPQPDCLSEYEIPHVGVLGGCLSVVDSLYTYNRTKFDLWVMKIYGVNESWTKLVSIAHPSSPFRSLRAVTYSKAGDKLLLEQDEKLFVWYDLGNKTFEKVKVRGLPLYFNAKICLGSLVPVNSGGSNVN